MSTDLTLPRGSEKLPDAKGWTNRFTLKSATSDRLYIVAQRETSGEWGCSCPGWRVHRKCKHLRTLGLIGHTEKVNLR